VDRRLHQRWTFNHFFIAVWRAKAAESVRVKRYWEIIPAISRKPAGTCATLPLWIRTSERSRFTDAHCGDGKRVIVRADERLAAYFEVERAIKALRKP
jgi:hypothetical protein